VWFKDILSSCPFAFLTFKVSDLLGAKSLRPRIEILSSGEILS